MAGIYNNFRRKPKKSQKRYPHLLPTQGASGCRQVDCLRGYAETLAPSCRLPQHSANIAAYCRCIRTSNMGDWPSSFMPPVFDELQGLVNLFTPVPSGHAFQ